MNYWLSKSFIFKKCNLVSFSCVICMLKTFFTLLKNTTDLLPYSPRLWWIHWYLIRTLLPGQPQHQGWKVWGNGLDHQQGWRTTYDGCMPSVGCIYQVALVERVLPIKCRHCWMDNWGYSKPSADKRVRPHNLCAFLVIFLILSFTPANSNFCKN